MRAGAGAGVAPDRAGPAAGGERYRGHRFRGANAALQRAINRSLVLRHLLEQGPTSRAALAVVTGLNKTTISLVADELLAERFLHEVGTHQGRAGRPAILLELHPTAHLMVGVHIDYGAVRTVLSNPAAQVVGRWEERFTINPDPGPALALVRRHIDAAQSAAAARGASVLGVGAVVGGLLDDAGVLVHSMHLGWRQLHLHEALQAITDLPVFLERGTNAALLAEHYFGAARGARLAAYMRHAGRGLGAAVLVGGELLAGARHLGGEVGHMVVEPNGPRCVCGSWGCLEAVASEDGLLRHVARLQAELVPSRRSGTP